jgi:hypothetical protein
MTIPDLFVLASKAVKGIAALLESQKRIESQNATIVQLLRATRDNSRYRRELAAVKRENRELHQLLNKEVNFTNKTGKIKL